MKAGPPVYADANIIIALIENQDKELLQFLRRLNDANGLMYTSEITLTETLVAPLRENNDRLVSRYEDLLSTGDGMAVIPVGRSNSANSRRTAGTVRKPNPGCHPCRLGPRMRTPSSTVLGQAPEGAGRASPGRGLEELSNLEVV